MGVSMTDVRREAVVGYELADERMMERRLEVSRVVGISEGDSCWNKSGWVESGEHKLLIKRGGGVWVHTKL